MKKLCYLSREHKFSCLSAMTTIFSLLLAVCMVFTACADETEEFRTGTRLQLDVATAKIESRALIESATLPDGHSIGLMLVDGSGTQYDGVTYRNVKATA